MNKKLIILTTLLLSGVYVFSQDIIVSKDSKRIDAKVLEVNINDIKYRDWDNQDGPIYTILKSNIASIIYQNGKVETFSNAQQPTSPEKQLPNAPGGMTLTMFQSMGDRAQHNYFAQHVGGNMFKTFHSGVKLKRAGIGLLIPGLAMSVAGLALVIYGSVEYSSSSNYYDYYDYYDDEARACYIAGLVLLPVGQVFTIVSIPLSAVGGAKKKWAQNEFKKTYFKDTSLQTSLDFGITQRGAVGFMLKF